MTDIDKTMIESSLSDALSTMAFISPMPPEDLMTPQGPALLTRIAFSGITSGALELVCPLTFGAMLTANLLGTEPEAAECAAGAADALRELLNVICGAILRDSRLVHAGSVEMGVPTQQSFDLCEWDAFVDSGAIVVDAEGSKLALRQTGCN